MILIYLGLGVVAYGAVILVCSALNAWAGYVIEDEDGVALGLCAGLAATVASFVMMHGGSV